jgi:hypothetical protein
MKDLAVTGRTGWGFGFFHCVVSSSIRDMLIRTHKKLIVYNLCGELDRNISGSDLERRMTTERMNE